MPDLVFVRDVHGTPLMPMAAAYARKLVQAGKAHFQKHHAFTILQLKHVVETPALRPVVLGIAIHQETAELFLLAEGTREVFRLLYILTDLHTDLPRRLRRRAGHRRRRRARGRYRAARRYGQPAKLRRPSLTRSNWRTTLQRRLSIHKQGDSYTFPVSVHWRAQAISRVIAVLQTIVPLSHIVIRAKPSGKIRHTVEPESSVRRQQLISAYGASTITGRRIAMCAYCRTTRGPIEVDHIVPRSRGGTNAWSNLVLACRTCNERKGDNTPEEAGMMLHIKRVREPSFAPRAYIDVRQTERLLQRQYAQPDVALIWQRSNSQVITELTEPLREELQKFIDDTQSASMMIVARPIARPRKQVFSSRNYPLTTPERAPFTRVGQTIKRRVRVNSGLAVWRMDSEMKIQVVGATDRQPDAPAQVIRIGMMCEAKRAGHIVIGIVSAIHTTGRLTLLVPDVTTGVRVSWKRVVVIPRLHLRVLSNEGVALFPLVVQERA